MKASSSNARDAYALHQDGLKAKEIAAELGFSTTHARVLVIQGERLARAEAGLLDDPNDLRMLCDAMQLSRRTGSALLKAGINSLVDVAGYGERALLRMPKMGKGGLAELKNLLALRGLKLADDPNSDPGQKNYAGSSPLPASPPLHSSEMAELAKSLAERYDTEGLLDLVEKLLQHIESRSRSSGKG